MSDAAAIMGTFVRIKTLADGTPRIELDLACGLSEVAALGLAPGVPFALARMTQEAANPATTGESSAVETKEKPGPLCVLACQFCADPMFQKWVDADDEAGAKSAIVKTCGIESRKELDFDERAQRIFHNRIRKPFMAWRDAQRAK